MSPRTHRLPPVLGLPPVLVLLLLTGACGAPPEALPTSPAWPRLSAVPSGGLPAGGPVPSLAPTAYTPPAASGAAPTYTYPTYTYPTPTTAPTTTSSSPNPTPSQAPRCTGEPTGAQIVALAKTSPSVPDKTLTVTDGPYCSGSWSFTVLGLSGAEPLSVVATGKGSTLELVTAGTDVCNPRVKAQAPAGIRVLACGY